MRALVFASLLLWVGTVQAQESSLPPGGTGPEAVDTTRLDVDRLPPEALPPARSLYDQGLFVEAQLGGMTFAGDARQVSRGGPRFAVAVGYELTRWFALWIAAEGSQHMTKNRPPPSHTSYELTLGTVGARFTLPLDARHALSAAGLFSVAWASRDVLRGLDFRDSFRPGVAYGGELGYDFHLPSRHHSLGVLAGARQFPSLARDGVTIGVHATAYLRYVF